MLAAASFKKQIITASNCVGRKLSAFGLLLGSTDANPHQQVVRSVADKHLEAIVDPFLGVGVLLLVYSVFTPRSILKHCFGVQSPPHQARQHTTVKGLHMEARVAKG